MAGLGLVVSLGARVDYRTSYDSLGHDLMVRGGRKQVWWDDSKKPDECQVCVPGAESQCWMGAHERARIGVTNALGTGRPDAREQITALPSPPIAAQLTPHHSLLPARAWPMPHHCLYWLLPR